MSTKVLIDVDARHEALARRAVSLIEELEQLALTAPDGTVFDACEGAVVEQGRAFQVKLLRETAARRLKAVEKKGSRSAAAAAVVRRRTAGPENAD